METTLDNAELTILETKYKEGKEMAIKWGISFFFLSILFSLIPAGLIPSRKVRNMDPHLSLFQSVGLSYTIFFVLGMVVIIVGIILSASDFFKLRRDIKNNKKVVFNAKIIKVEVVSGDEGIVQILHLMPNKYAITSPVVKLGMLPSNVGRGSIVKLHAARAAKHVFKVEAV